MTDWLLLLGSNHGNGGAIDRALAELAIIGAVDCLCRRQMPPRSGCGAWYFNALVTIRCVEDMPTESLRAQLRDIEQRLGRDRTDPNRVRIDIDILAHRDEEWVADTHALAKGELESNPAATLLVEAGLKIRGLGKEGV